MIAHFLRPLFILLEVVVLFNLLIIVHELGHFLAARWRGLVIEGFGVWFGKPLWAKTINGVQYSLGSIPFGGFVKLPQLAPMDIIEGKADVDRAQLPRISALDKIIVAFAGPLFSLLLALAFACIVWVVGHPVSASDMTTTIGYVQTDSPAAKAGMRPGDKILSVDNKRVSRFLGMSDSVGWNVIRSEGATIPFDIERDGKTMHFDVTPYLAPTSGWQRRSVRQVLISPEEEGIIGEVAPHSAAAAAGLQKGDKVEALNGNPIFSPLAVIDFVEKHPQETLSLEIKRGPSELSVQARPAIVDGEKTPRLGIKFDSSGSVSISHPNPIEQVYNSITGTLTTIGAVASPKSDVKLQHMSGPIGIGNLMYRLFGSEYGWQLALWFSVLLNVNLAILNMLPMPVLDGGHIALALIESARRKPVNTRVLEFIQTACAVLIIGYMLYITFFDVQDLPFIRDRLNKTDAPAQKGELGQ
ncbi:MAG: RIP metalloprotease RseP [Verrucomicrobiota bacterium]|nr:RIP metalloprotease RseP [Verrucomicrobiota bacterium]